MFVFSLLLHCIHSTSFSTQDASVVTLFAKVNTWATLINSYWPLLVSAAMGFLATGMGFHRNQLKLLVFPGRWLRHVLKMPLARWEVALGCKSLIVIYAWHLEVPETITTYWYIVSVWVTFHCFDICPPKCSPYQQGLRFSFQCCILEGDFKQLTHGPQVFEVWSWVTCSWPCYAFVLRFWCAPGWFCWLWGHWSPVSITSMLGSDASAEISSCSF